MTCEGCSISIRRASINFESREHSIKFLQDHGIIVENVLCTTCGNPASFSPPKCLWRCQRRHRTKQGHKVINKKCNFKRSVRADSWIENTNLTPEKTCTFLAMYILLNPPHQQMLVDELELSSATVCDWSHFIREVLEDWCIDNSVKQLGGEGHIVEIDEAKFGHRKYNRGRIIEGQWIFGGFDRDTGEVFMEPVPNRSAAVLLEIIQRRIKPGTTIMSDCWKAYNCLNNEGIFWTLIYSLMHPIIEPFIHLSINTFNSLLSHLFI